MIIIIINKLIKKKISKAHVFLAKRENRKREKWIHDPLIQPPSTHRNPNLCISKQ